MTVTFVTNNRRLRCPCTGTKDGTRTPAWPEPEPKRADTCRSEAETAGRDHAEILAALLAGGVLTYLSAKREVAQEIEAAMSVSQATVERAMQAVSRSYRPEQHLASIVSVFDGGPPCARLPGDPRGDVVITSQQPPLPNSVPVWFAGPVGRTTRR